jgi:hypothetical protein
LSQTHGGGALSDSPTRGRPTLYNEDMALKVLDLAVKGKTDLQIAKAVKINVDTLYTWKLEHPDFSEALKKAKEVADDAVEASLRQRALGYKHKAIKFFCHEGCIISEVYTERYPPDTTACIFWLKNRRPDRWRDVNRQEHSGPDGKPIETSSAVQVVITLPSNGREAKEG